MLTREGKRESFPRTQLAVPAPGRRCSARVRCPPGRTAALPQSLRQWPGPRVAEAGEAAGPWGVREDGDRPGDDPPCGEGLGAGCSNRLAPQSTEERGGEKPLLWPGWETWKPTRCSKEGFQRRVWGNDSAVTATVTCVHLSAPRGRWGTGWKSGLATGLYVNPGGGEGRLRGQASLFNRGLPSQ